MDVKLPKLGEGADSGVVVNLFVKEGDTVAAGQAILELENEKAVASVPSSAAGVVTGIYVKPGDKIVVGQRLITLAEAGKPAAASTLAPARPERGAEAEPTQEPVVEELAEAGEAQAPTATPVAPPSIRKLALDLGIDLRRVRGTGPGGRIGVPDVRAYIQRLQKAAQKPAPPAAPAAKPPPERIDFSNWGPVSHKPLTPLREVIARRMLENWNAVPRVTQFDDADFTALNELRKKHAPAYEQKGARLTLTPLVLKAVVDTLKKYPVLNSSLDEAAQELVLKDYYHIGIAVDTEQGLIVPVLREADKKSLLELARELEQLAQKARDRKVTAEELKGGTFTISNQGGIGSGHFTPIVNKPEVAILGLGRGALKPVARDSKVVVRLMVPLALSYDHRVIDGGVAARFMVDLVKALEGFGEEGVRL